MPPRRECWVDRFWRKVDKSGACWLWTGTKYTKGYGQFSRFGVHQRAHRVSWELSNGMIPDNMAVCHKCDIPACVNPEHLFLGTPADNTQDMIRKGRYRSRLLTEGNVRDILALRGAMLKTDIAKMYGVDRSTISKIHTRVNWKSVPFPEEP